MKSRKGNYKMKLELSGERLVVVGKTFEESCWGYMQFPALSETADGRIGLSVHNADDAPHELSIDNKMYFVTEDKGNSRRSATREERELKLKVLSPENVVDNIKTYLDKTKKNI